MHFLKLLKIERIKCKRSKIIPFIFIAPILVVSSGVANLSTYFTPEYTQAWPCLFRVPFSTPTICCLSV